MNIKHKKPTLTKKQRHRLCVLQVRRQKIFLTCLFLLIVGCILLRFSKFSGRQEEAHQINAACEAYRDEVSLKLCYTVFRKSKKEANANEKI